MTLLSRLLLLSTLLVITPWHTHAQQGRSSAIGGYFDLSFESLTVRGDRGLVTGIGFGLVFNHDLSVGLGGYGLWSATITTATIALSPASARLHIVWGGAEAEKILVRTGRFCLSLQAFAGVGNVQLPTSAFNDIVHHLQETGTARGQAKTEDSDQFLFARPIVSLQWQADSWLMVSFNACYKFASGISYFTLSDADLRGFDLGVKVAIGSF